MYKVLKFDLARNALRYLVQECQIKEMYIPYYLCDVIRHMLVEEGCKPLFYNIDDNFYPTCDFPKGSYILYPNYFGICSCNVKNLAEKYQNLITDNAHAYFNEPLGFACFNAGHKFNKKDSLLWLKDDLEQNNQKYYDEKEKDLYKRLYWELHKEYSSKNLLSEIIQPSAISFVYPFLAETEKQADDLVKELKKKGKTVYRYWNSLPKNFNEYKFYSRLVPIPVLP